MTEHELDRYLSERAWLFELSLDPMVVGRFDGSLRVVNGAYQRLVGLELHEILETPIAGGLHPDDLEHAALQLDRLTRGESLTDFIVRVRGADGDYRWIAWTVTPSPAERLFYAVGRDITEQNQVEEHLAAQAEELARSNADLEQFASVVAHDMSQPLRVIAGYAELLAGEHGKPLGAEGRQFVERIQAGAHRLQLLTRDLLAYCRMGQGQLRQEAVDLNRLVADVLANLEMSLTDADVAVGDLPSACGDPTQLAQVVQNLVANAAAYARPGVRVKIDISGRRQEGFAEVVIADNGIGIPPEERKRIFEMFERLDQSDQSTGTGIGLAICARVISRHGGRIWVEDARDAGSRFCFTLPNR